MVPVTSIIDGSVGFTSSCLNKCSKWERSIQRVSRGSKVLVASPAVPMNDLMQLGSVPLVGSQPFARGSMALRRETQYPADAIFPLLFTGQLLYSSAPTSGRP